MPSSSLLINIPPLEPESLMAAGAILPLIAESGMELTLVEVDAEHYAASCLVPPAVLPLNVTGSSRADCLVKLLALLAPPPPVVVVPEPEPVPEP